MSTTEPPREHPNIHSCLKKTLRFFSLAFFFLLFSRRTSSWAVPLAAVWDQASEPRQQPNPKQPASISMTSWRMTRFRPPLRKKSPPHPPQPPSQNPLRQQRLLRSRRLQRPCRRLQPKGAAARLITRAFPYFVSIYACLIVSRLLYQTNNCFMYVNEVQSSSVFKILRLLLKS